MKKGELFVICALVILFVALVIGMRTKKSPFSFRVGRGVGGMPIFDQEDLKYVTDLPKNSDYQYFNPNLKNEMGYYECLSNECGGNTEDYDCLERCKLKTFMGRYVSPLKEVLCRDKTGKDYYDCLVHYYSRST